MHTSVVADLPSPVVCREGYRVAGRTFTAEDVAVITALASTWDASRTELAVRTCEALAWRRSSGAPKWRECRDLLEALERDGWLVLPAKRRGRPLGASTKIPVTAAGEPGEPLVGSVGDFGPVSVERITRRPDHDLFRELVGRYHTLGYRVPYGAQLRYLVYVGQPRRTVVGAFQVSSPAWRLAVRDRWIGWDDARRAECLQRVVNNSRFLVLPWIRIRYLASRALSLLARRLAADWEARYGVKPLLIETMVDVSRHRGTCYAAANWLDLGLTTGRGRMDRHHERHGCAPKRVLVYPLTPDAVAQLVAQA